MVLSIEGVVITVTTSYVKGEDIITPTDYDDVESPKHHALFQRFRSGYI